MSKRGATKIGVKGNDGKKKRNRTTRSNNVRIAPVSIAESTDVRLRYQIKGIIGGGGAFSHGLRWQPNCAFDVDPVLGSTSTPGFAEWAAMYSYYRVHRVTTHVVVCNLDNLAIEVSALVSNVDPGTVGSDWGTKAASSAFGFVGTLAPFYSGRGEQTIHRSFQVHKVLGMPVMQADSFRSPTTTVPTDKIFWGLAISSIAGTATVNGCSYDGWIEMETRFYGRYSTLTSLPRDPAYLEAVRRVFKEQQSKDMVAALETRQKIEKQAREEDEKRVLKYLTRTQSQGTLVLST